MEIPGLKKALVKMMSDYNLQISVQEGCKKTLSNDYFNLHERLVKCHQKGIFIDGWYLLESIDSSCNSINNHDGLLYQMISCAECATGK